MTENFDPVAKPQHYNSGRFETLDVIEDIVQHAPDSITAVSQSQVIKYVSRMFLKGKPLEDAKKAHFYLSRLISRLEAQQKQQQQEEEE